LGYANRDAIRASFRELPNDHSDIGAMAAVPTEAELHTREVSVCAIAVAWKVAATVADRYR